MLAAVGEAATGKDSPVPFPFIGKLVKLTLTIAPRPLTPAEEKRLSRESRSGGTRRVSSYEPSGSIAGPTMPESIYSPRGGEPWG